MGREFSAMEDDFELSLELSIGGWFGKSKNTEERFRNEENPSRSISEEFSRKNQKNISNFTENKNLGSGKQVQTPGNGNGNGDRNESRNSSIDCGSSRSSSSFISDYWSTSLKGGSSSESESLSNSSGANQSRCDSRGDWIEGLVVNPCSKTHTQSNHVGSFQHMPRVSARGNDPNGKTITGVLYKYNKSEVCIMCACHGASFSPAEFVQHAGATNVSHPLKHITILSSR